MILHLITGKKMLRFHKKELARDAKWYKLLDTKSFKKERR
jgi:hypothetical protein